MSNHKNRFGWTAAILSGLAIGGAAFGINTMLGNPIPAFGTEAATIVAEAAPNKEVAPDDVVSDADIGEPTVAEPTMITEDLQWFKDLAEYDRDWVCTVTTPHVEVGDGITTKEAWSDTTGSPTIITFTGMKLDEVQTILDRQRPSGLATCHNSQGDEEVLETDWDKVNRRRANFRPNGCLGGPCPITPQEPVRDEVIERTRSFQHHSILFPEIWP